MESKVARWIGRGVIGLGLGLGAAQARADAVPPPGAEVVNGGFEDATTAPWQIYGPVRELTTEGAASGDKALRLGITGDGTNREAGAYQDVLGSGAGPARVTAAIAVDEDLSDDALVELKLEVFERASGTQIAAAYASVIAGPRDAGAYRTYRACVDLDRIDTVMLRPVVLVRSAGGAGSGAIRVDDITIDLGASATCPTTGGSSDDGCRAGGALGGMAFGAAIALALARRRGRARA
ncbi:MAG: hypothetical protein IT385_17450 [Deltaproteobacteria bacterium]|nr:hypothetical protein [Deltaproteobacteria bacterium]